MVAKCGEIDDLLSVSLNPMFLMYQKTFPPQKWRQKSPPVPEEVSGLQKGCSHSGTGTRYFETPLEQAPKGDVVWGPRPSPRMHAGCSDLPAGLDRILVGNPGWDQCKQSCLRSVIGKSQITVQIAI